MDDKISLIVGMGFTPEQASQALAATNNDAENAIAYLLDDPVEEITPLGAPSAGPTPPPPPPPPARPEPVVRVVNPENIPDLDEVPRYYDSMPSIFASPVARDPGTPTVVLPATARAVDNYVLPFVHIMSQVDSFREAVYSYASELEYDPRWANDTLEVAGSDSERFVAVLQLMVAYLTSTVTTRAYVASRALQASYPPDLRRDFALADDYEECLKRFVVAVDAHLKIVAGAAPGLVPMFLSTVESTAEPGQTTRLGVFVIEPETRRANIYDCVTSLFWGEGPVGAVRFKHTAPVLAFQVYGDDLAEPFSLDEVFYPGLYTGECADEAAAVNEEVVSLRQDRNRLGTEMMEYNAFEGRSIQGMLRQAGSQLGNPPELTSIAEAVGECKKSLTTQMEQVSGELEQRNLFRRDRLLSRMSHHQLPAYVVTGVIFSDTEYFYRSKDYDDDRCWVHVQAQTGRGYAVTGCSMERASFDEVRDYVYEQTGSPRTSVMLYYTLESAFDEKLEVKVPTSIDEFFVRDNVEIAEMDTPDDSVDSDSQTSQAGLIVLDSDESEA
ncbi:hypothetical protein DICA0_C07404 [Diutina catenulata]